MSKMYLIAQTKTGRWYVYRDDMPLPLFGSFGTKKHALAFAADKMGLTVEQYVKAVVRWKEK